MKNSRKQVIFIVENALNWMITPAKLSEMTFEVTLNNVTDVFCSRIFLIFYSIIIFGTVPLVLFWKNEWNATNVRVERCRILLV